MHAFAFFVALILGVVIGGTSGEPELGLFLFIFLWLGQYVALFALTLLFHFPLQVIAILLGISIFGGDDEC